MQISPDSKTVFYRADQDTDNVFELYVTRILTGDATFSIGGTVSGLAGSGLVLRNSTGENLPISADGAFAFVNELANSINFTVTVLTQPANPDQICSITNGSGTVSGADVSDVSVTCDTGELLFKDSFE